MSETNWNEQFEYLSKSRFLYHNDDYLEFLVTKVWKLSEPQNIIDFGCGYGYIGMKLLPLLPAGSTYTGIDSADDLLTKARELFRLSPYQTEFINSGVYKTPFADEKFTLSICHVVLMHLNEAEQALQEMIRVTANYGKIVTCEANRLGHSSLFYVDELNREGVSDLGFLQQNFTAILREKGIDYNIGMKMPVLMHKAGLQEIDSRISDSVKFYYPEMDEPLREKLFQAILSEGYGRVIDEKSVGKIRKCLTDLGFTEEEAITEIKKEQLLTNQLRENGRNYHLVYPGVLNFTSGRVIRKPVKLEI